MGCQIRRAGIEDIPAVYSFERAYMQEIEPDGVERWMNAIPRHLRQWITNLPRMFVAVQDEEVIGHCFWEADGASAVLASIYVTPVWRRQGCARRLLECFEQDDVTQGFTHRTLGVYRGNPARLLYIQAGYQPTHTHGDYDYYEKAVL